MSKSNLVVEFPTKCRFCIDGQIASSRINKYVQCTLCNILAVCPACGLDRPLKGFYFGHKNYSKCSFCNVVLHLNETLLSNVANGKITALMPHGLSKISKQRSPTNVTHMEVMDTGEVRYRNKESCFYYDDDHQLHREDGPAIELIGGHRTWYRHGKLHREDGPAIELINGDKHWYFNGKLHREDGPAIELFDGRKQWFIFGKELTVDEFKKFKINKKIVDGDTHYNLSNGLHHRINGPAIIRRDGSKEWWVNGRHHREDGPAIELANGNKYWCVNNVFHRNDGPAFESSNGSEKWFEKGRLHRVTGPAIIMKRASNQETCKWYKNGRLHRNDGPAVTTSEGDEKWYINDKLHREDGPAVTLVNGTKKWYTEGKLHRIGMPAIQYKNGSEKWYEKGRLHRENGPAVDMADGLKEFWVRGKKVKRLASQPHHRVVEPNGDVIYYKGNLKHNDFGPAIFRECGTKEWYQDGELHREDGPAIEQANGDKAWFINGTRHREDGPAIECADGPKSWYINGKLHREDGPAIEFADGTKFWYINGELLDEQELNDRNLRRVVNASGKIKYYNKEGQIHRENGPAVEFSDGTKSWYINGQVHRDDAPAIEYANGNKGWYQNGKRHREDGPAIEYASGEKRWYINGQLHREDGPAIERSDGTKSWYINDNKLTEQEFNDQNKITTPTIITNDDVKVWYKNNERHREDGPAVIHATGEKEWWFEGKRHREDGPAVEYNEGNNEWWLHGKRVDDKDIEVLFNKNKTSIVTEENDVVVFESGLQKRYDDKRRLHHDTLPALVLANGSRFWYQHGELHREFDRPAIEYYNGRKEWWMKNVLHRISGPAVQSGSVSEWWIKGKKLTKQEFRDYDLIKDVSNGDILYYNAAKQLHRQGEPAVIKRNGDKIWYYNGLIHRGKDLPAYEHAHGVHEWYAYGKRHRVGKPAVMVSDIYSEWWLNGQRHREDGPAIQTVTGYDEWWLNGKKLTKQEFLTSNKKIHKTQTKAVATKLANGSIVWKKGNMIHREDGPALEYANGTKNWYQEGVLHRLDGPAISSNAGDKIWYKNGKLHRDDGPAVEYVNGNKSWYQDGQRHREDGPACVFANGTQSWYFHGKKLTEEEFKNNQSFKMKDDDDGYVKYRNVKGYLHRLGGPAVIANNGYTAWYKNGQLHRLNGPAVESPSGHRSWYIEGSKFTEQEFNDRDLTKVVSDKGTISYYNKAKQLHRVGGPAFITRDGTKSWHKNGKLHREDGPAVEYTDGSKFWHINGHALTKQEFNDLKSKPKQVISCCAYCGNEDDNCPYCRTTTSPDLITDPKVLRSLSQKTPAPSFNTLFNTCPDCKSHRVAPVAEGMMCVKCKSVWVPDENISHNLDLGTSNKSKLWDNECPKCKTKDKVVLANDATLVCSNCSHSFSVLDPKNSTSVIKTASIMTNSLDQKTTPKLCPSCHNGFVHNGQCMRCRVKLNDNPKDTAMITCRSCNHQEPIADADIHYTCGACEEMQFVRIPIPIIEIDDVPLKDNVDLDDASEMVQELMQYLHTIREQVDLGHNVDDEFDHVEGCIQNLIEILGEPKSSSFDGNKDELYLSSDDLINQSDTDEYSLGLDDGLNFRKFKNFSTYASLDAEYSEVQVKDLGSDLLTNEVSYDSFDRRPLDSKLWFPDKKLNHNNVWDDGVDPMCQCGGSLYTVKDVTLCSRCGEEYTHICCKCSSLIHDGRCVACGKNCDCDECNKAYGVFDDSDSDLDLDEVDFKDDLNDISEDDYLDLPHNCTICNVLVKRGICSKCSKKCQCKSCVELYGELPDKVQKKKNNKGSSLIEIIAAQTLPS